MLAAVNRAHVLHLCAHTPSSSRTLTTRPCPSAPAPFLIQINLIFRFLQSKQRILVWLYESPDTRIEGRIIGFDEYMNLVMDDAEEVSVRRKARKPVGRILLKGDNITLMQTVGRAPGSAVGPAGGGAPAVMPGPPAE